MSTNFSPHVFLASSSRVKIVGYWLTQKKQKGMDYKLFTPVQRARMDNAGEVISEKGQNRFFLQQLWVPVAEMAGTLPSLW
jgi:hypothetical protein